jgi:D-alanyl-D-alanine dipeptidase
MSKDEVKMTRPDEAARRQFWSESMERGYALLRAMETYEVNECGEGLASIPDAAADAGVEVVFSDTKLAGEMDRIYSIRKSLIPDLMEACREMNERGWILKIEDGFRTREMQTRLGRTEAIFDAIVGMCRWECGRDIPPMDLLDRRTTSLIANYPNKGTHTMGAAVDVSVLRRADGSEVWRGKPYLHMSELTPMESPFVTPEELQNRREITAVMERHGLLHYPGEFWHYNKGDAAYHLLAKTGQPAIYGPVHWDPKSGEVTPFDNVSSPLTPPDLMAENLRAALKRLAGC